jgi:hypothetical protein
VTRRHQPSKVDRLPEPVRDLVGQLRRQGRTIDEIMAKLAELDLPPEDVPSRSSVGRFVKQAGAIAEEMRRQRQIGEILVESHGREADTRTSRINIGLAQGLLTRLMFTEDGEKATLDAKEAHFICASIQSLASAAKADTEREMKLRAEAERKTKAAAAKAVESVAREQGLSADTVAAIRARILGVQVG